MFLRFITRPNIPGKIFSL
jgi:hypothetical protein